MNKTNKKFGHIKARSNDPDNDTEKAREESTHKPDWILLYDKENKNNNNDKLFENGTTPNTQVLEEKIYDWHTSETNRQQEKLSWPYSVVTKQSPNQTRKSLAQMSKSVELQRKVNFTAATSP